MKGLGFTILFTIVFTLVAFASIGESHGAVNLPDAFAPEQEDSWSTEDLAIKCTALIIPHIFVAAGEIIEQSRISITEADGSVHWIVMYVMGVATTAMRSLNRIVVVALPCELVPIFSVQLNLPGAYTPGILFDTIAKDEPGDCK